MHGGLVAVLLLRRFRQSFTLSASACLLVFCFVSVVGVTILMSEGMRFILYLS